MEEIDHKEKCTQKMRLLFLGTGTSVGVPQVGCNCEVCKSTDPLDRRMRASALLTFDDGKTILIDCGPDFRSQMLISTPNSIEGVLLTHSHYDHVGGVDDLRPFCSHGNLPLYCQADVAQDLRDRLPYCFREHLYPGVPKIELVEIKPNVPFDVSGHQVVPLAVEHGKLPILGFKIGKLAYITDCSHMPSTTLEQLQDIEVLVLNALRFYPHPTHFCLDESIECAKSTSAKRVYFTHMCHDIGLASRLSLPEGMSLAHDQLEIEI